MVSIKDGVLQPLSELLPKELFPTDLFSSEDDKGSILDRIYILDSSFTESPLGPVLAATIAFEGEVAFGIPACPSLKIVIGAGLTDYTVVPVRILLAADWYIEFDKFKIALRVDRSIMHPVDPNVQYTEITLESTVRITAKTIELVEAPGLSLPKSYLGETQIAISATDIKFDFRRDASIPEVMAAGLGESFMGIYIKDAEIDLPPDLNVPLPSKLKFAECFIGSGGFTGQISASWGTGGTPAPSGSLFGFEFELHSVGLELRESAFVKASISGLLKKIPYFDKPGLVDISFGANGSLSVSLAQTQPTGVSVSPDGLLRLEIPAVAQLDVQALAFEHDQAGTRLYLSGRLTPLVNIGGQWPALQLKRLGIDTNGRITVEGGWIDLPDQYSINLGGFSLELSRIGFGVVEGSQDDRWFGLTGGISFTEFLPAGVSVDGLRVKFGPNYPTPSVSFEGIGLEFGVPSVFRFAGNVTYHQLADGSTEFRGAAKLDLYAVDVSTDVQIVIGHNAAPSFNYTFLFLDAKLVPSGIPILNTGLSLYGFAGLYAQNMAPKLNTTLPESERWYQWYKTPQFGVADLAKWDRKQGEMGIGLGVTFGTADAGFSFNAKTLFVILLPKPVIMIDGKANFLTVPTPQTSGSEGAFHAFALYDSQSGIIEVAVDANYSIPVLLEAHADARAHFETANSGNWFVALGEDQPPEHRVTAHLLGGILDGWMFLRIDPTNVKLGAGLEFHKKLSAGPAWIKVDASAYVLAKLAYTPPQFEATAVLEGSARAGIKGVSIGVSIYVRADIAAPKPFLIKARFKACADLLITTVCVEFPFEIRDDEAPEILGPLEAVSIIHPHPVMESTGNPAKSVWPLDLGGTSTSGIPPDGLIDITFRRQVVNATGSFVNGDAFEDKWHAVGEISDYRYQYRATAFRLFDEAGGSPSEVAAAPLVATHGAWQRSSSVNTVLEIGATTPFSGSSSSITNLPCYDPKIVPPPCDPLPPPRTEWICEDVAIPAEQAEAWNLDVQRSQPTYLTHMASAVANVRGEPGMSYRQEETDDKCKPRVHHTLRQILRIIFYDPRRRAPLFGLGLLGLLVTMMGVQVSGAFFFFAVLVVLAAVVVYIGIVIVAEWLSDEVAHIYCGEGCRCRGYLGAPGGIPSGPPSGPEAPGGAPGGVPGGGGTVIVHICREVVVTDGRTRETAAEQQARIQAWITETSSWSQTKDILKPNTNYRLEIDVTTELLKHDTQFSITSSTSIIMFKTGGPPSEPGALEPYVLWTVPAFAPGATSRRAYRGYDIGILFKETYLDVMYIASGDDLELRLLDNNGNPILDAAGNPVVLSNVWGHAPNRVLTREETVMTERLEAGGCLPTIEWSKQPLATASPSTVGLLRPETYHEVHVTRKNDPAKKILARYSFVTSRFTTFSDMISSFMSSLAIPKDGTGLTPTVLAATDFGTMAAALGIVPTARPERFTVSPLRAGQQTKGLLLNSPEPIEWARTMLTVHAGTPAVSYSGAKVRVIANADETMALVLALDAANNPVSLPDGPCELEFRFSRYLNSSVPIYAVQGDSNQEVVKITFTLGAQP